MLSIRSRARTAAEFDADAIRANFPALSEQIYRHPLVYLNNAAY